NDTVNQRDRVLLQCVTTTCECERVKACLIWIVVFDRLEFRASRKKQIVTCGRGYVANTVTGATKVRRWIVAAPCELRRRIRFGGASNTCREHRSHQQESKSAGRC